MKSTTNYICLVIIIYVIIQFLGGCSNYTNEKVLISPSNSEGTVVGTIIDKKSKRPLVHYTIYLGFKIFLTPGPEYNYGFYELTSPKGVTDENGKFVINGVDGGEYILIVYSPSAISAVMDSSGQHELIVKVMPGKILDLGVLEVNDPVSNDAD